MLSNGITIRDAITNDIADLTLLINELGYPTNVSEMEVRFKAIVNHPDYKTQVVVLNDEIVAMAGLVKGIYYEKTGGYVRIVAFVVKQSSRKKGIGKALMIAIEEWAITQNCHTLLLTSRKSSEREAAYAFYQNAGFSITSSGFVKQL